MKKIVLIFLSLMFLTSCNNLSFPIKIGDSINDIGEKIDDVNSCYEYNGYYFFEWNSKNVVIYSSNFIVEDVKVFSKNIKEENYKKIKNGMTVFDVVELIGLPYDSKTSGRMSLEFKSYNNQPFVVYFNYDVNNHMVVSDLI